MDPSSILVFDLETTGKNSRTAEILQISIVDGNGNDIFNSYVRPTHRKSWKKAEDKNGISPQMVENAPTFSKIKTEVQACFNKADLIAGYNSNGYDIPIIERYGIVVPQNRFDVMQEFRRFTGKKRDYKLSDCAAEYGVQCAPHDAREDAVAAARCMQEMIRQPNFVNTDPPKARRKRETQAVYEPNIQKQQEVHYRDPLFSKYRFSALLFGLLLILISFGIICFKTYGVQFLLHPNIIEFTKILKVITSDRINIILGVLFITGCVFFRYGLVRRCIRSFRWIINLPKWLISRISK